MFYTYEKVKEIIESFINFLGKFELNDINNYWEYLTEDSEQLKTTDNFSISNEFLFLHKLPIIKDLEIYLSYWQELYLYILIYIIASILLTLILISLAFLASPKEISFEKSSSYECGFEHIFLKLSIVWYTKWFNSKVIHSNCKKR